MPPSVETVSAAAVHEQRGNVSRATKVYCESGHCSATDEVIVET